MKKLLSVLLVLISIPVFALDEEEDYDSIVNRLSTKNVFSAPRDFSFENVLFHVGVGYNSMALGLETARNDRTINQSGFGFSFGVDLLSPRWNAEIGFANYARATESNLSSSLKEFSLRVLYKDFFSSFWGYRAGAGLAARYLSWSSPEDSGEYTSPDSLIFGGFEARVASNISLISELSYKRPLISESPVKQSLELMFRIDGHL